MTALKNKRRRGASLVEVLVIISVGAVVIGGVTTGITALLSVSTRITQADDNRRLLTGLTRQLRQDLHIARNVDWDASRLRLTLTTDGKQKVQYRWLEDRVERSMQDRVTPWRLPEGLQVRCEPEGAATLETLRITVIPAEPGKPIRIVACVGRDLPGVKQAEDSP